MENGAPDLRTDAERGIASAFPNEAAVTLASVIARGSAGVIPEGRACPQERLDCRCVGGDLRALASAVP
jgi:hypothetical protein